MRFTIQDWFIRCLRSPFTLRSEILGKFDDRLIPFDKADFIGLGTKEEADKIRSAMNEETPDCGASTIHITMCAIEISEFRERANKEPCIPEQKREGSFGWILIQKVEGRYSCYGPAADTSIQNVDGRSRFSDNNTKMFDVLGSTNIPEPGSALYNGSEMIRQGYGTILIASLHIEPAST